MSHLERLTAITARDLTKEAQRGAENIDPFMEAIYKRIRAEASKRDGATQIRVEWAELTHGMPILTSQSQAIYAMLREDGYIVEMGPGGLTINWGRMA